MAGHADHELNALRNQMVREQIAAKLKAKKLPAMVPKSGRMQDPAPDGNFVNHDNRDTRANLKDGY